MRIVINHLTRMSGQSICVAGIDLKTGSHVRLLPRLGHNFDTIHLIRNDGFLGIGRVLELDRPIHAGCIPEVEDHIVPIERIRAIEKMAPDEFWQLMDENSSSELVDLFGDDLHKTGNGATVDAGCGIASLGCLIPGRGTSIIIDGKKVRLSLFWIDSYLNPSVTDVRLYEEDNRTPSMERTQWVQSKLRKGATIILAMGLARAWSRDGEAQKRHWLQVNGIHFKDDPIWHEN